MREPVQVAALIQLDGAVSHRGGHSGDARGDRYKLHEESALGADDRRQTVGLQVRGGGSARRQRREA